MQEIWNSEKVLIEVSGFELVKIDNHEIVLRRTGEEPLVSIVFQAGVRMRVRTRDVQFELDGRNRRTRFLYDAGELVCDNLCAKLTYTNAATSFTGREILEVFHATASEIPDNFHDEPSIMLVEVTP